MAEYAPGMRVIIRDEEWMIKKADLNSYGNSTLQCVGITPLVKDKQAYFLSDLEKIEPHLKLRSGKEEKENQRLHFWYDKDRRRIVIGYLGEHLDSVSGRRKS